MKKHIMIIVSVIIGVFALFMRLETLFPSYIAIEKDGSYQYELKNLSAKKRALITSNQLAQLKIDNYNDSIEKMESLLRAYQDHLPQAKQSLEDIAAKKRQAVDSHNWHEYVSQDSIYMDSVSGLISLYESMIEFQSNKSAIQDSIITNYQRREKNSELIHEQSIAMLRMEHQKLQTKLNDKLKRVRRQRNISLSLNAVLTGLLFWKK